MPRGEYDREERKARTRRKLLEAAAKVYARGGFEGATLDDVAAEAGYSKGAVYGHFGSKENLLMALMREHLAAEIAEQVSLFDRGTRTWDRPLRGSEAWMEHLEENPDHFRLFIEVWGLAQRDERLRDQLATGMAAMRATMAGFAAASAADAGFEPKPESNERFGEIVIALSLGLPLIKLIDPDAEPGPLLGVTLSLLIRALETSEEARAMFADPEAAAAELRESPRGEE
ncbi:MAG TPA: TetR/AcrR family transcriptional regulator [Solirubrobacteraceae bacterium]|jgi:AcrR family transcriptional regulator